MRLAHGQDLALPAYATADSAGMDLLSAEAGPVTLEPGARAMIAAYNTELAANGHRAPVTTELGARGDVFLAEDYHQQYLAKNPNGYCGIGGTGVSCPLPQVKAGQNQPAKPDGSALATSTDGQTALKGGAAGPYDPKFSENRLRDSIIA